MSGSETLNPNPQLTIQPWTALPHLWDDLNDGTESLRRLMMHGTAVDSSFRDGDNNVCAADISVITVGCCGQPQAVSIADGTVRIVAAVASGLNSHRHHLQEVDVVGSVLRYGRQDPIAPLEIDPEKDLLPGQGCARDNGDLMEVNKYMH